MASDADIIETMRRNRNYSLYRERTAYNNQMLRFGVPTEFRLLLINDYNTYAMFMEYWKAIDYDAIISNVKQEYVESRNEYVNNHNGNDDSLYFNVLQYDCEHDDELTASTIISNLMTNKSLYGSELLMLFFLKTYSNDDMKTVSAIMKHASIVKFYDDLLVEGYPVEYAIQSAIISKNQ